MGKFQEKNVEEPFLKIFVESTKGSSAAGIQGGIPRDISEITLGEIHREMVRGTFVGIHMETFLEKPLENPPLMLDAISLEILAQANAVVTLKKTQEGFI